MATETKRGGEVGIKNWGSNLMDSRSQQMIHTYLREVQSAAWFSEAKFLRREVIYASPGFQHQINEIGKETRMDGRGKVYSRLPRLSLGKIERSNEGNYLGF